MFIRLDLVAVRNSTLEIVGDTNERKSLIT